MAKKVLVLLVLPLQGNVYQPGQVVEFDDKLAKSLDGSVDANPDTVAYHVGQGVQIIKHTPTEAEIERIASVDAVSSDSAATPEAQ